jgi:2-polyprenyl-6-methoxyphenol hydroxylase-like FAD-dependent oxidoreductase
MKKIIIIGGGIGGLCAAIALQKAGIEAHVYEKVPRIKGLGAGITLSINAILALRKIGIEEALLKAGQALQSMSILDEKGKTIAQTDLKPVAKRYGTTNFSIHRAKLHEILIAHLQPATLHTGKAFATCKQDEGRVHVQFADGSEAEGDALLAFDGIHSAVRRQFLPQAQIRYAGYTCWRAVIDYVPETAPDHATESWGRGKRFGLVPIGGGKLYWFATANAVEQDARMQQMSAAELTDYFSDFHSPVGDILRLTHDHQLIWNDIIDLQPINQYAFGRVALGGDAAHATTPNMGQGAGMAIEDAVTAARLLSENEVQKALQLYESARLKRTHNIVNASYRLGAVAQWENNWLRSVRNAAFRMIPVSVQEKQMRQLYDVAL